MCGFLWENGGVFLWENEGFISFFLLVVKIAQQSLFFMCFLCKYGKKITLLLRKNAFFCLNYRISDKFGLFFAPKWLIFNQKWHIFAQK
jgi:hypothetical protein